ncbi:hypothetical protein ACHAXR_011237 [Thalassiosira sp. AJA248-18]
MQKEKAIPIVGRRTIYGGIGARLALTAQGAPNPPTSVLTSDEIDTKCRLVLSEISRCESCEEQYIESSVLHSVPQTFVPSELCVELGLELDRLLTEQILREERLLATVSTSPIDPRHLEPKLLGDTIASSDTNDSDLCVACNNHCKWAPFCDANELARRRKALYRELKSAEKYAAKTIQSVVARSALNGGETKFIRTELITELSDEIQQIDSKLKLAHIDNELHRTHASKNESVSIQSIHGYDTTVKRQDALWALEHEHNKHVAQLAASETIDSILDWMVAGWYFGEQDIKEKRLLTEVPSFDQRGTFVDKATSVQWESNTNAIRDANANARDVMRDANASVETNMKYGLFCLTFMYFRMLHVLRKEKATWDGSNDLVSLRHGPPLSEERKKIIQEEKNEVFRTARIEYAMQKARAGEERKKMRLENERLEKAKIREWGNKKKQAEQRLATTVQRVFRGHLGRRIAMTRALQQERAVYDEALANACATDIARVWRGFCGRVDAGYLRAEMAKFLFAIREEEARDEEEEYLATTNRLQRYIKKKERNQ